MRMVRVVALLLAAAAVLAAPAANAKYVKYDRLDMRGFDLVDNKHCGITPQDCQDLCDVINDNSATDTSTTTPCGGFTFVTVGTDDAYSGGTDCCYLKSFVEADGLTGFRSGDQGFTMQYEQFSTYIPDQCPTFGNPGSYFASENEINYGTDFTCEPMATPTAWQRGNAPGSASKYDLVIAGGGIGATYLVNRIYEECVRAGVRVPTIAMAEKGQWVGGRLQSSLYTGNFGLVTVPPNPAGSSSGHFPLPEYGGMRIDPSRYPLIFNKVVQLANERGGPGTCLSFEQCRDKEAEDNVQSANCCPMFLSPMNVGSIGFNTQDPSMPAYLRGSSVTDPSQLYGVTYGPNNSITYNITYGLESLAENRGSVYDNCIQITTCITPFFEAINETVPALAIDAVKEMCSRDKCNLVAGMCDLCVKFEDPERMLKSAITCTGYDMDWSSLTTASLQGLTEEVTNSDGNTKLYLLNNGFQGIAQLLLYVNSTSRVAPMFGKELVAVQTTCSEGDQQRLAYEQVDSIDKPNSTSGASCPELPSQPPLKLQFRDGSTLTAKAAYMTMLPYQVHTISPLQDWGPAIDGALDRSAAVKLVLGWENASEAPPARLNKTACVPGPCQRVILGGSLVDQNWIVRQMWFWSPEEIMIYDIAPFDQPDGTPGLYPRNRMARMAREQGLDAVVSSVMAQIREGTGLTDLADPTWGRLKDWPAGNLAIGWKGEYGLDKPLAEKFSDHLRQPLGPHVPLWYGNSEAAADGTLHGWAEGALDMAERSLQGIFDTLGYNITVQPSTSEWPTPPS